MLLLLQPRSEDDEPALLLPQQRPRSRSAARCRRPAVSSPPRWPASPLPQITAAKPRAVCCCCSYCYSPPIMLDKMNIPTTADLAALQSRERRRQREGQEGPAAAASRRTLPATHGGQRRRQLRGGRPRQAPCASGGLERRPLFTGWASALTSLARTCRCRLEAPRLRRP